MRVLVTGASGFVGQELLLSLDRRAVSGVACGRQAPAGAPLGWQSLQRSAILESDREIGPIDAIVHLEVKHHVRTKDYHSMAEMIAVNTEGTVQWLTWASKRHVKRFVFASSIKAAGLDTARNSALNAGATNAYGVSKAKAEQAVTLWSEEDHSRAATILRLAPIYGPGNTANLAAFARRILLGRRAYVGLGQTKKSVVSMRNAIAAFEWALYQPAVGCKVFNVSDPGTLTVKEFAAIIANAGNAPSPRGLPLQLARVAALLGDIYGRVVGHPFVFDSCRLNALLEDTVFPASEMMQHGFVHPQQTRDGVGQLVQWLMHSEAGRSACKWEDRNA